MSTNRESNTNLPTEQPRQIRDILARRTDLSTFLVHLTRDTRDGQTAKQNLKAILASQTLEGRSAFGSACRILRDKQLPTDSQKCVCLTETPLERVSLLLGKIDGRHYDFKPYGVAISKMQGRQRGLNPVWYLDITPGHDWLTNAVELLIDQAMNNSNFDGQPIAKLSPYIEQMGSGANSSTGNRYSKEFWWEREWRHVGDFELPQRLIVFCPEDEIPEFKKYVGTDGRGNDRIKPKFVDPHWSLERIIGHLAGFSSSDLDPFQTMVEN